MTSVVLGADATLRIVITRTALAFLRHRFTGFYGLLPFGGKILDGFAATGLPQFRRVPALAHGGVQLLDQVLVVFGDHEMEEVGGDAVAAVVFDARIIGLRGGEVGA